MAVKSTVEWECLCGYWWSCHIYKNEFHQWMISIKHREGSERFAQEYRLDINKDNWEIASLVMSAIIRWQETASDMCEFLPAARYPRVRTM